MRIKDLGSQGLKASQLGLGCMGMSEFYGPHNDEESLRTLRRAIELEITFWDTADMYGPYHNEELVGKALKGNREKITLATKFGILRDPSNVDFRGLSGKPAYVQSSCEASLKRLGVDVIDLYYLHRVDPATPIEDTVGAMARLVEQGKIRGIGLSEVSAPTLEKAHKIHPISAVQNEYSLWSRDPEDEVLPDCQALGVAFVAYSPLGRGFLTGQISKFEDFADDDYRRTSPRFQGENFQKNLQLIEKLKEFAKKKGCTPAELAIAWVLEQGGHVFPIPGAKTVKHLEENAKAADIDLTQEELIEINALLPKSEVAGSRYPEASMKTVNA